jgi:hypothetical protein
VARDTRTYVRIHDGLAEHPKLLGAGGSIPGALAGWLYVCGIFYCSRQSTDGLLPTAIIARLSDIPDPGAIASRLLQAGLWHAPGHTCQSCVQPPQDSYLVHDYLEHQRSKAEIGELSAKRSAAGRKGGVASGESRGAQQSPKQVLAESSKQIEAPSAATVAQAPRPPPRRAGRVAAVWSSARCDEGCFIVGTVVRRAGNPAGARRPGERDPGPLAGGRSGSENPFLPGLAAGPFMDRFLRRARF